MRRRFLNRARALRTPTPTTLELGATVRATSLIAVLEAPAQVTLSSTARGRRLVDMWRGLLLMLSEYGRVFGEAGCGDLSTGHRRIVGGCFSWWMAMMVGRQVGIW